VPQLASLLPSGEKRTSQTSSLEWLAIVFGLEKSQSGQELLRQLVWQGA
jgi:hypothetical protein